MLAICAAPLTLILYLNSSEFIEFLKPHWKVNFSLDFKFLIPDELDRRLVKSAESRHTQIFVCEYVIM
jgi:hypothetical protein